MEIRILQETELANAAGLSRYVFDNCVKYRMEFPQTIEFVEDYLTADNLLKLYGEGKLVVWGVFVDEQLVGVSGMQSDGMITMLYVLPQCCGKGYGSSLLNTMRVYGKSVLGKEKIFVNATPAWASTYFVKQGFAFLLKNQDMHVPFVTLYTDCTPIGVVQKKRVPASVMIGAGVGCFLLATIVCIAFVLWYI